VIMDASRHIVSTTVTTFGGFLPLILEGSEFWPPFAMAIAGGVLLSTVVSFYLVPPLYTLLMHPKRHFFQHDQFQHDQFQHDQFQHDQFQGNQFEPDQAPQNKPALDTLSSEAP
jgi:hypothetical protein